MRCRSCGKEETWLEKIGKDFICHKCVQKHRIMGLIFRTNVSTFKQILKKLKPKSYEEYMKLERKQIESAADLKKAGIYLKTTNVIDL